MRSSQDMKDAPKVSPCQTARAIAAVSLVVSVPETVLGVQRLRQRQQLQRQDGRGRQQLGLHLNVLGLANRVGLFHRSRLERMA